jgi:hypothetical protein
VAKRSTAKRESLKAGKTKMFAKRDTKGQFKEMDAVGRSLSTDQRKPAKKKVKSGFGDQGDRRRKGTVKKR